MSAANTSPEQTELIALTRTWVREIVVGESLCPFASGLADSERLSISVAPFGDAEGLLRTLARASCQLAGQALAGQEPEQIETSLVLHPRLFDHPHEGFAAQFDFLVAVEALLEDLKLDETLQVVSFHPDYCFEDAEADDPANYTNRSPFGMFHLLRRQSVQAAVSAHPDPDSIWQRNVTHLRELGSTRLEAKLEALRALASVPARGEA